MDYIDLKTKLLDHNVDRPIILNKFHPTSKWKFSSMTPEKLANLLDDFALKFRVGKMENSGIQWEGGCRYVNASVKQFLNWMNSCGDCGLFDEFSNTEYWAYADYIYMRDLFKNVEGFDVLDQVKWSSLGYKGIEGEDAAVWMGTKGAHTVCHYDTYGYNLVLQVYGRKRWILFPPTDTDCLYPTRLPYEESSVFSKVNILNPDLSKHPRFPSSHPHIIELEPGDLLFVPQHWWHFVENLELSISVNAWFPSASDSRNRLSEAVARLLVSSSMHYAGEDTGWLNPTESMSTIGGNMMLLQNSVSELHSKSYTGERTTKLACEPHSKETSVKCGCHLQVEHPNLPGMYIDQFCFTHARKVFEHWQNMPANHERHRKRKLDHDDDSNSASRSREAATSLTYRDFVECITCPRVVDCITDELENVIFAKHKGHF